MRTCRCVPFIYIGILLLALLTGIASAYFGIGGGSIIVPSLIILFFYDPKLAVGTGAICVPFIASSSSFFHHRMGAVDREVGLSIALGSVPGAFIGAMLTGPASSEILAIALGLVLLFSALRLLFNGVRPEGHVGRRSAFFLGLLAGMVAGLVGIGGGIIIVPALVLAGVDPHRSVATSSFVIIFTGTASALTHAYLGHVDYLAAGIIIAGAVPGTMLGVWLAHKTKAHHLKAILGIFLLLMAVRILVGAVT